jgi:hypothetical protein
MKATLLPLHILPTPDEEFNTQLEALRSLLAEEAELLPPQRLGSSLAAAAEMDAGIDAVVFPQMLGEAYRKLGDFAAIRVPILVATSEFGTVSMWDWEINRYLALEGVRVIAPYNLAQTRLVCRSLALKRELGRSSLLVYQDNPGAGFQAGIFKRFYWWEDECLRRMRENFGVAVVKRSFRELGRRAKGIADAQAEAVWEEIRRRVPVGAISREALLSAVKVYMAVKADLAEIAGQGDYPIAAVGINCLNESHFSDSTPCLAWNLLYEEQGMLWGCEADTVSMLTMRLVHSATRAPLMMTNLYPFLMGMAALKHERIPQFPSVAEQPENHILAAHCGYLGVAPRAFSTQWTLRGKVLAIVDERATAIDARLPEGPITLVKLEPDLQGISVIEGSLEGYAQFPGSDCLNGAVLRVPDGHRVMRELASHHTILALGRLRNDLELTAAVFGLDLRAL